MESSAYNLPEFFKFFKDNEGRMVRRTEQYHKAVDWAPSQLRFSECEEGHFLAELYHELDNGGHLISSVYSRSAFSNPVHQKIRTTAEGWDTYYEDTPGVWRVSGRYVFTS